MILKQTQIRVDFGLFDDPEDNYVTIVFEGDKNNGVCRVGKTLIYVGEEAETRFDKLSMIDGEISKSILFLLGFKSKFG